MINERLFLKMLLALFSSLVLAELLVVLLFGFRLELILFWFILAAAVTGILVVVRLLDQHQPESDSVSSRRARLKLSDVTGYRLSEYDVDDEFLGKERTISEKRGDYSPSSVTELSSSSHIVSEKQISVLERYSLDSESFDEYISRCMTGADDERCPKEGITVDLDDAALLRGEGRPPEDFAHNPKTIMASLKQAGMKR